MWKFFYKQQTWQFWQTCELKIVLNKDRTVWQRQDSFEQRQNSFKQTQGSLLKTLNSFPCVAIHGCVVHPNQSADLCSKLKVNKKAQNTKDIYRRTPLNININKVNKLFTFKWCKIWLMAAEKQCRQ